MMHKLFAVVTRLESDGLKMRKARSESILMNPISQQQHVRSGLANSATAVGRELQPMTLSDRISEMQRYALPPEQNPYWTASSESAASATILSSRGHWDGAVSASADAPPTTRVLPMGISPRRHLAIPALLRRSPKLPTQYMSSASRSGDGGDASLPARAVPDAIHSKRSKHHQHHHVSSSRSKPGFFKRGSLSMLRSSPRASGATSLADQLWATERPLEADDAPTSPSPAYLRRGSANECEYISSIRE